MYIFLNFFVIVLIVLLHLIVLLYNTIVFFNCIIRVLHSAARSSSGIWKDKVDSGAEILKKIFLDMSQEFHIK